MSGARTVEDMRDAVIVGAVRTPVGRRNGGLSGIHPVDLSAHVLRALADRAGFAAMLEMAVSTIRGLALLDTINPGEGRNADQWPFARAVLAARFERL